MNPLLEFCYSSLFTSGTSLDCNVYWCTKTGESERNSHKIKVNLLLKFLTAMPTMHQTSTFMHSYTFFSSHILQTTSNFLHFTFRWQKMQAITLPHDCTELHYMDKLCKVLLVKIKKTKHGKRKISVWIWVGKGTGRLSKMSLYPCNLRIKTSNYSLNHHISKFA